MVAESGVFTGVLVLDIANVAEKFRYCSERSALDQNAIFGSDNKLLITGTGEVIDLNTGEIVQTLVDVNPILDRNGTLIAVSTRATPSGYCAFYTINGYPWPYLVGLIETKGTVNIRQRPSTDGPILRGQDGKLFVFARTRNNSWFKVGYYIESVRDFGTGWIAASVLDIIDLPDDVRVADQ